MKKEKTKKEYVEYLNELGQSLTEDNYIIGGRMRHFYWPNHYGDALRKFDPIAFQAGYNDWKLLK